MLTLGAMIVACGGNGDTSAAETSTADVHVTLLDYTFAPDTVTVPAGAEVTITVTNASDSFAHNWVLLAAGPLVTAEDERDEDDIIVSLLAEVTDRVIANVLAGPQAEQQDTFIAPTAGTYQVICTVARHFGFGMEGTLIVEG